MAKRHKNIVMHGVLQTVWIRYGKFWARSTKKIMCIMLFYNLKKEYAEEKRIQKNRLRTQTWDQVMNCVKNTPKRLGSVDEKSRDYTELYFL